MTNTLDTLGWSGFFASQIPPDDEDLQPARVAEVHRDRLTVLTPTGQVTSCAG